MLLNVTSLWTCRTFQQLGADSEGIQSLHKVQAMGRTLEVLSLFMRYRPWGGLWRYSVSSRGTGLGADSGGIQSLHEVQALGRTLMVLSLFTKHMRLFSFVSV